MDVSNAVKKVISVANVPIKMAEVLVVEEEEEVVEEVVVEEGEEEAEEVQ